MDNQETAEYEALINAYGYKGRLTKDVLKVIGEHWPLVGGGMMEGFHRHLEESGFS
jgi:hypothetical protein